MVSLSTATRTELPGLRIQDATVSGVLLAVSTSAVLLSLCVGVPAAYTFARFPFTGRTFLFFTLLVMRMLPPIAVLVPMYVLFSKLGLATTRFSVVLADTTFALPLVVWLMRGFFEDLPVELEESAWIDGASRYRAFWHIVLPLARPGLVAASILCLQLAWNDFLFAAVLTNNATQTLPVMMAAFNAGDSGVDWGGLTASGVLVILPVIIFSFYGTLINDPQLSKTAGRWAWATVPGYTSKAQSRTWIDGHFLSVPKYAKYPDWSLDSSRENP
jgi:ABC-type glycerol-3-phosphate transport system permease component